MEKISIAPAINPGERIRQIYYELQGVSRIQDPDERSRILSDYRLELDRIGGGLKSTINGDIPGLLFDEWVRNTPGLSKADRDVYRAVRGEWQRLKKEADKEKRRLLAYRGQFDGARAAFLKWFDAPSDKAVSEIFAGTFKVDKNSRITWKGKPVEAILFARAIGIKTATFNATFINPAEGHPIYQDSAYKPGRRKNTDKVPAPPEIVKTVARFINVTSREITLEFNMALIDKLDFA